MLRRLAHYSVRTEDLAASTRFYVDVLGLRIGARPPFGFPGVWLYLEIDNPSEQGCVHLIGAKEGPALRNYLGSGVRSAADTGALDHIAFFATDWPATRQRLDQHAVSFVERFVPGLNLRQVFMNDPNGVTIELNYPYPLP